MEYTRGQAEAMKLIKNWYLHEERQVFSLTGCAGTGKSVLISHVTQELGINDSIAYATFVGRAAVNLNAKGVPAITIHRLIYKKDPESLKLKFIKRDYLEANYKLIIIDEFSMVDKKMYSDLLSFGVKILVVGDYAQLPPIGEDTHLLQHADYKLTEIVRTAQDSPIVKLSQMVLNGVSLRKGVMDKCVYIVDRDTIPDELLLRANQVLCGQNKTRILLNKKMRDLKGFYDYLPVAGDKMLCVRNNWDVVCGEMPLVNGTVGYCDFIKMSDNDLFIMGFKSEFSPDETTILRVDASYFLGKSRRDTVEANQFDFGYAITVHKAQGSEYNNVVVFKDYMPTQVATRWLYTAVTRAKKNLVIGI